MTDLERRMLEGEKFYVDGWTSERGRAAAANLEQQGFVTSFEGGSDASQYTAINYTITDKGRKALL